MDEREAPSPATTEGVRADTDAHRPVFIVSPPPSAGPDVTRILVISLTIVAVLTVAGFMLVAMLTPDMPELPVVTPAVDTGSPGEGPVIQPTVQEDAAPTVELAQAALKRAEPRLWDRLPRQNEPRVGEAKDGTTYSWEYVEKGSSTASVRRVIVILDDRGRLVRIEKD